MMMRIELRFIEFARSCRQSPPGRRRNSYVSVNYSNRAYKSYGLSFFVQGKGIHIGYVGIWPSESKCTAATRNCVSGYYFKSFEQAPGGKVLRFGVLGVAIRRSAGDLQSP